MPGGLVGGLALVLRDDDARAGRKRRRRRRQKNPCSCPVCRVCQGGRCVTEANYTRCRECGLCIGGDCKPPPIEPFDFCGVCRVCVGDGVCVLRDDDSPCDGNGRCLGGTCNQPPVCAPAGTIPCATGSDTGCCSGECCSDFGPLACCPSEAGERCLGDGDCAETGRCVGYRCSLAF